jgi:hypothetical protein
MVKGIVNLQHMNREKAHKSVVQTATRIKVVRKTFGPEAFMIGIPHGVIK